MFAIIRTGGKQYKVFKDTKVVVEKIESAVGSEIILDQVLMVGTDSSTVIGDPLVKGAQVVAIVEKHTRDDKVIIFKKKRRHNYRRKKGHKQHKTMLKIVDILKDGKSSSKAAEKAVAAVKEAKVEAASKPKKASTKKED